MKSRGILLLLIFFVTGIAESCETKREVFIDNELTKVWRTTICPNQKLPFHKHQYPRVVIPEQNGTLKVIYQSGREVLVHLKKEKPLLASKSQGSELHQDVNIGKRVIRVMVIELKQQ